MTNVPSLVVHGASVGLRTLTGLNFDPSRPYAGCRICGRIFQSRFDRDPVGVFRTQGAFRSEEHVNAYALQLRKGWSQTHAKTHSAHEHLSLALSGRWCTPEAAEKLAAFGTISIIDLVMDNEVNSALATSSAVPADDVEE